MERAWHGLSLTSFRNSHYNCGELSIIVDDLIIRSLGGLSVKTVGNIIAELRREAGYTQKMLAEALNITDKAVSKWERGLSLPDVSLLPKLSAILDADIELLLREGIIRSQKEWAGMIDLREYEIDLARIVYDKPIVYFVLSHFLLMDIHDVYVLGQMEIQSWLTWNCFEQIGFRFYLNPDELPKQNIMIMQHPCFIFGSDLTKRCKAAMSTDKITKLCPEWDITPFLFCPEEYTFMYFKNPEYLHKNAVIRSLGRGMVCLPIDTPDQINDVASFVRIYQTNTGLLVEDILDIAERKKQQQICVRSECSGQGIL